MDSKVTMTNPAAKPQTPVPPAGTFTTTKPTVEVGGKGGGKNMMVLIVAIVVILLVAVVGGAYYYIKSQQSQNTATVPEEMHTASPTPASTKEASESGSLEDQLNNIDLGDENSAVKDIDTQLNNL